MTTFTSTQSGNWADGASWGLNSPGVAGVDYPGLTGDVVNVSDGHTITYNAGVNANVFGNITLSGTLTFLTYTNSDLIIGAAATLTVNATGSLLMGTETTPIQSPYKARLLFVNPASLRVCFTCLDGATVKFYGDAGYYGNVFKTTLKTDWTSGQSLIVDGDVSAWPVGATFVLGKNVVYGSYLTDGQAYTIASAVYDSGNDQTVLTISEAAPGLSFMVDNHGWTNMVFLLTRNIFIGVDALGITKNVYFRPYQAATSQNIHFDNVQFQSIYGDGQSVVGTSLNNPTYNRCSFRAINYAMDHSIGASITECIAFSCDYVCNTSTQITVDDLYLLCSHYGFRGRDLKPGNHFTVIHSGYGIYYANTDIDITCVCCYDGASYHFAGSMTAYGCTAVFADGDIDAQVFVRGCTSLVTSYARGSLYGSVADCTYTMEDGYHIRFTGDIDTIAIRYMDYEPFSFVCENSLIGGISRPYTAHSWSGILSSVFSGDTGWHQPPSLNSWGLLFSPNANVLNEALALNSAASSSMWTVPGDSLFTLKIYPEGFTTSLTNAAFLVTVIYFDSIGGTTVRSTNVTATYENGAWRLVNVPIAPGKEGFLFWNVWLKIDGGTVLVDPIPVIS